MTAAVNAIDTAEVTRRLRAIADLKTSPGWKVLRETLDANVNNATARLVTEDGMAESQMHHARGSLLATMNFRRLPESLEEFLTQQLRIAATGAPTPFVPNRDEIRRQKENAA